MKPGQNPMFVLSTLEEKSAQLNTISRWHLIKPLFGFEYEIEKRTFSSRLHLDREQVLLAIRIRYENLQRQRRERVGREGMPVTLLSLTRGTRLLAAYIRRGFVDADEEWGEGKIWVWSGRAKARKRW